jgi:hypothetical protein
MPHDLLRHDWAMKYLQASRTASLLGGSGAQGPSLPETALPDPVFCSDVTLTGPLSWSRQSSATERAAGRAAPHLVPQETRLLMIVPTTSATEPDHDQDLQEEVDRDETVISDAALSQAAGGLNPQPLPPRWGGRRGF